MPAMRLCQFTPATMEVRPADYGHRKMSPLATAGHGDQHHRENLHRPNGLAGCFESKNALNMLEESWRFLDSLDTDHWRPGQKQEFKERQLNLGVAFFVKQMVWHQFDRGRSFWVWSPSRPSSPTSPPACLGGLGSDRFSTLAAGEMHRLWSDRFLRWRSFAIWTAQASAKAAIFHVLSKEVGAG